MLGRFEVWVEGRLLPETSWRRRRAADLVKLLALAPSQRLTREQVMDAFWPDLDPIRAAANLRKAGYHAREALGVPEGVVHEREIVVLGRGFDIVTDVSDFVRAAQSALADDDRGASRNAASLYSGELLPDDRYATWCSRERDRLASLHIRVLEHGELWGRIVEVEPSHERAHQKIIAGHLEKGDRVAALRQFEQLRVALREELGVLPDMVSTALYEEALSLDTPDTPTPAERARALLAWGVVHWERRDIEEAERTANGARALAIDAGLGRELAEASELLGLIAYAQGKWREVFAHQFIESIRPTPTMTEFLFDAHMCMSEFALSEVDGLRDVGELAETILAASREVGSQQGAARPSA
ncbi:MAG: BTAD domain-containing putative transcriptional regulator, partial [Acidimicrobiia bacterium]